MIERRELVQAGQWRSVAARIAVQWERWDRNFSTRRQLRNLDEHELRDIGINRESALAEARKPFWQD